MVDVKLQQWMEKELPKQSVALGHRLLIDEFENLIERKRKSSNHDPITSDLKVKVVNACQARHQWDHKALDSLVKFDSIFMKIKTNRFCS